MNVLKTHREPLLRLGIGLFLFLTIGLILYSFFSPVLARGLLLVASLSLLTSTIYFLLIRPIKSMVTNQREYRHSTPKGFISANSEELFWLTIFLLAVTITVTCILEPEYVTYVVYALFGIPVSLFAIALLVTVITFIIYFSSFILAVLRTLFELLILDPVKMLRSSKNSKS